MQKSSTTRVNYHFVRDARQINMEDDFGDEVLVQRLSKVPHVHFTRERVFAILGILSHNTRVNFVFQIWRARGCSP